MLFGNPSAVWGILFFFGLIAIYIYKRRSRNYKVSSLMFFAKSKSTAEGGQKLNKLETPFIFFLELLILFFLILAIAGPMHLQKGKLIPVTIILDDSVSMLAEAENDSPRQKALQYLKKNIFSENLYRFTLLKAGTSVNIIGKRDLTGNEALDALKAWNCNSAFCDVLGAVNRGTEMSSEEALIIVVTDFYNKDSLSQNVKWLAFGKSIDNIAITSASRITTETADRCFFEFTNFSEIEKDINAEIINEKNNKIIEKIDGKIRAGDSRRIIVKIKDKDASIKATIKNDNVVLDNEAVLVPIIRKKIKVSLNVNNKKLESAIKKAVSSTELAYISELTPDIIITDNEFNSQQPNFLKMIFHIASQPVLLRTIIAADKEHEVTNNLPIDQSLLAVDKNIKLNTNSSILLSSGEIPILWIDSSNLGFSILGFNYCFDYSNIHQTSFWPVLFFNIIEWASNKLNGPDYFNYRSGSKVEVYVDNHTNNIQVISLNDNNKKEEYPVIYGKSVFTANKVGLYEIKDGINNYKISINLCSYEESDLRNKSSFQSQIDVLTNENMNHFESARWWFVIIAFLLLILHQWLVSKRRSGYAF